MLPIRNVVIQQQESGIVLLVYLDEGIWDTELADELGKPTSFSRKALLNWIKENYPQIKKGTVKIIVGSIVIGTITLPSLDPSASHAAAAASGVTQQQQIRVIIDGEVLPLIDHPYVQQGRVLVPIRDIAESMGALVEWDGANNQVCIDNGSTNVLLTLNSKQIVVNGFKSTTDVAPQVIHNRTYVPVRLFAEKFGAEVNWLQSSQTVVITKGDVQYSAIEVDQIHGYTVVDYQGDRSSLRSLQKLNQNITSTSTFTHRLEADGTLSTPFGVPIDTIDYAKAQGVPIYMLVHNFYNEGLNYDTLHQVLSDPTKRETLINNILSELKKYGYNGVEIDLEGIGEVDRDNYTQLLSDLKNKLTLENFKLNVAVPAKTYDSKDHWSGGYDYKQIGEIVDQVLIMSYDEHWSGGTAGPISSLPWYERVVSYAAKNIPKEKLLMGLGTYGYDWPASGPARALSLTGVENQIAKYGGTPQMDEKSASPFYQYTDQSGVAHILWFENEVSIKEKVKVANQYGVKGVGIWRLGLEKESLWQVLKLDQNKVNT